jgi:hypothetical protein
MLRKPNVLGNDWIEFLLPLEPTNISTAFISKPFMLSVAAYSLSDGSPKARLREKVI